MIEGTAELFGVPIASTIIGPLTVGLLLALILWMVRATTEARKAAKVEREKVLEALRVAATELGRRLDNQDDALAAQSTAIKAVDKELHPNGGSSMRDDVRLALDAAHENGAKVTEIDAKLTAHLNRSEYDLDRIDKAVVELQK